MATPVAVAPYKAPSNIKPTILVLVLSAIWPIVLITRILRSENGIHDLNVSRTVLWGLAWLAQIRYYTMPFFTSPLRALPRPSDERMIIGNGRAMVKRPPYGAFTRYMRETPNEGFIQLRGFLHFSRLILITSPAALTEVLNTKAYDFQKPNAARKFLARILGHGLILVEGKEHKAQRKAVAPAFLGKNVRELVPLFWSKAIQMVNVIATGGLYANDPNRASIGRASILAHKDENEGKVIIDAQGRKVVEVEINSLASRATLDIIGKAGLGRDFNTLENSGDELAKQYDVILDPERKMFVLFVLVNILLPAWLVRKIPWKMNQRIIAAADKLRILARGFVSDKRVSMATEKKANLDVDILSVLLRNSDISDDGLVDQMLTFLAAGHETTSSALTWTCWLLGRYPATQRRLREELSSSPLTDFTTPINAEILESLPYLQAVCAEVLRLYPTVPVTARHAVVDTSILGQVIPKGTQVMLCPWAINRAPELWGSDSDEFRPERWLEESEDSKVGKMNSYEFITFLHGPRSCIGQGFARSELKCLLAALVLKFEIELVDKVNIPEPVGAITIKPKGGMRLRLTEVKA